MRRFATLILIAFLGAAPLRAGGSALPDLGSGDTAARLAAAAEARGRDVTALARALLARGEGSGSDADLEFLAAYATKERNRALRLLAVSSAERLDRAGAYGAFAKIATAPGDELPRALAAEALGYLAKDEHVEAVAALLRDPSEVVALAAADALARFAPPEDLDVVLAAGLGSGNEHVLAHVARAALDISRSASRVEKACRKAEKADGALAPRVGVVLAALEDGSPKPFRWGPALTEVRRLAAGAPPELVVWGYNPDLQDWMDEWLVWIRKNRPATLWLVASVFDRVNATNGKGHSKFDLRKRIVELGYDDASLAAERLTVRLARRAVLGLRRTLGEPFEDHRGWEAAFFDTYDHCVAAGIDGAGSAGGASLAHYLRKTVARRPWEWGED